MGMKTLEVQVLLEVQTDTIAPETPIAVMQQVGAALGIEPGKLTEEVLKAPPSKSSEGKSPNDAE